MAVPATPLSLEEVARLTDAQARDLLLTHPAVVTGPVRPEAGFNPADLAFAAQAALAQARARLWEILQAAPELPEALARAADALTSGRGPGGVAALVLVMLLAIAAARVVEWRLSPLAAAGPAQPAPARATPPLSTLPLATPPRSTLPLATPPLSTLPLATLPLAPLPVGLLTLRLRRMALALLHGVWRLAVFGVTAAAVFFVIAGSDSRDWIAFSYALSTILVLRGFAVLLTAWLSPEAAAWRLPALSDDQARRLRATMLTANAVGAVGFFTCSLFATLGVRGDVHYLFLLMVGTALTLALSAAMIANRHALSGQIRVPEEPVPADTAPLPAPPSVAPDSPAPPSPAPESAAPDAPLSPAPPSPAPPSPAPPSPAPESVAPDAPGSVALPSVAPESVAPDAPGSVAPGSAAPGAVAPGSPAPEPVAPPSPAPATSAAPTPALASPAAPPAAPASSVPGSGRGQSLRDRIALVYPWALAAGVQLIWLGLLVTGLLGGVALFGAGLLTIGLLTFVPGLDAALVRAARTAVATGDALSTAVLRVARLLLVLAVLGVLALAWRVNLTQGGGAAGLVVAAVLQTLLVLAIAYALWEALRLQLDRRIAIERAAMPADPGDLGEMEIGGTGLSRLGTLLPLLKRAGQVMIATVTLMIVLDTLGVPIAPLLAGAGVVGLAVGFGSQTLVRDIVSGAFFLIDDAFRLGEYVDLGTVKGAIERIGVRSLQLRHHLGALNTVPFGEIQTIQNYSRDWAIMKLQFRVPFETDPEQIRRLLKKVGQDLLSHPEVGGDFLQPFKSQGVVEVDDYGMVIGTKFMCRPGRQFLIRRHAYAAVQKAFAENGIEFCKPEVRVAIVGNARTGADGQPAQAVSLDDPQVTRAASAAAAQVIGRGGPAPGSSLALGLQSP